MSAIFSNKKYADIIPQNVFMQNVWPDLGLTKFWNKDGSLIGIYHDNTDQIILCPSKVDDVVKNTTVLEFIDAKKSVLSAFDVEKGEPEHTTRVLKKTEGAEYYDEHNKLLGSYNQKKRTITLEPVR